MIREGDHMLCGAAKRDGSPCRQRLRRDQAACRDHIGQLSDREKAFAEGWWEGYQVGHDRGWNLGTSIPLNVQHEIATRVEEELAARPCKHFRLRDRGGHQIVMVANHWAYRWGGDGDLQVGDTVWVPGTRYREPTTFPVTGLGSDYAGDLTTLTKRGNEPW